MCQFLVTQYEEKYITSINCYFDISSQSEHNNVHLNTVHPLVDTLSDFSQQNESFNAQMKGTREEAPCKWAQL